MEYVIRFDHKDPEAVTFYDGGGPSGGLFTDDLNEAVVYPSIPLAVTRLASILDTIGGEIYEGFDILPATVTGSEEETVVTTLDGFIVTWKRDSWKHFDSGEDVGHLFTPEESEAELYASRQDAWNRIGAVISESMGNPLYTNPEVTACTRVTEHLEVSQRRITI